MDAKERLMQIVEEKKDEFIKASDQIWSTPETRFAVEKSVQPYYEILEKEGFTIKKGIADMDYAFEATWGSGKPVIGMLAEYDALGNLTQVAGEVEHKPLVAGGNGHGCGHNVLGTAALAGAVAIKTLMEEEHLSGTIKLFGCPAEESGFGKAFMARDGIFNDLDLALANHPMDSMSGWGSSSLAVLQCYYEFSGTPAHAAAAPEMGRSALDAAELMNVGVQFLREHIIDPARIHYAFIDAGGESANVVQPSAKLYYFIRAPHVDQAKAIFARVNKIAEGAAIMTETKLTKEFDAGCSDFVANKPLTRAIDKNLDIVGPLELTDDEMAFEKKLSDTASEASKQNSYNRAKHSFPDWTEEQVRKEAEAGIALHKLPLEFTDETAGSTDVGDVSQVVPTAQFTNGFEPQGTSPHTWQWVSNGISSVAHKGLLLGGKVFALTAYDALTNPDLVEDAKKDFEEHFAGKQFESPIPAEVKPR